MEVSGGNLDNIGSALIITFENPFEDVKKIMTYSEKVTTETLDKYFQREFRYSHDGIEFSMWIDLEDILLQTINLSATLYLEVKYTRQGIDDTGTMVITEFDFVIDYEIPPTVQNQACPTPCEETNCQSFVPDCDDSLTFDPNQTAHLNCLQTAFNASVVKMQGKCSKYWRAILDEDSADVIFKEYSLGEMQPSKDLKIIIPENKLPDNQPIAEMTGLEFMDLPFEIHITLLSWQAVFGIDTYPTKQDAIYIEIIDKVYLVNDAYLYKPMGKDTGTYYKVSLVKYQDSINISKDEIVRNEFDSLTVSMDDITGEERHDEMKKIAKPQQYEIKTKATDSVRKSINKELTIVEYKLDNNWTAISNHYYDLSSITHNNIAVTYQETATFNDNLVFSCWFNLNVGIDASLTHTLIKSISGTNGINVYYDQNGINVWLNGDLTTFAPTIVEGEWYGIMINMSATFGQIEMSLYQIPPFDPMTNTEHLDTLPVQTFGNTIMTTVGTFDTETEYELIGGDLLLTNVRIFDKLIDDTNKPIILGQIVVEDNQHALLIDNAVKWLDLEHTNPIK